MVRGIRERGKTVLLTTHLMEEARNCDRVAIIDHGRIIDASTPAELVRRHCPECGAGDRRPVGRDPSSIRIPQVQSVPAAAAHHRRPGGRFRDQRDPVLADRIRVDRPTNLPTLEDVFLRLARDSRRRRRPCRAEI